MELNELHIADPATRAPGGGNAVAGGGIGVGGIQIHLTCAASGQNGLGCSKGGHLTGFYIQRIGPVTTVTCALQVPVSDRVHQHVVLKHRNVRRSLDPLNQGLLHGGTRRIGRVHDATLAVPALAGQVQFARVIVVFGEGHSQFAQPGNGLGCALYHRAGGIQIAQAAPGNQGVTHVLVDGVAFGQHSGHAALGPAARTVTQFPFGQHRHFAPGCQEQGCGEARQATTNNQNVEIVLEGYCSRVHTNGV